MHQGKIYIVTLIYIISIVLLTVYSYSQIDLNLTLSANRIYQDFQNQLIQLGYFNRPVSATYFILIVILLFICYLLLLYFSRRQSALISKIIYKLITLNIFSAVISYPAFSHDFFNYMFDARIVTKYNLNPYQYKALDFPNDLWIRFMRWTHRTYPYGPMWLLITLPFSLLGFAKFVPTLLLFKIMFGLFYLANIYLISLILAKEKKELRLMAIVFYAFNPLIIIESLVSPHNESAMLTFLFLSLYYLFIRKRRGSSLLWLIISILVKFVTVILLPLYLIKRKVEAKFMSILLKWALFLMLIPIFLEIYNREAYPWYFIPLLGISSLIRYGSLHIILISLSFGAVLRYAPYLYFGNYNKQTLEIMNYFLIIPLIFASTFILFRNFSKSFLSKR